MVNSYLLLGEPWIEVNHNDPNFVQKYETSLLNALEIVDYPVKAESPIVKILDFD
jgi:hypothetical protein